MITQQLMDWFRDLAANWIAGITIILPDVPTLPTWITSSVQHLYAAMFGSYGSAVASMFAAYLSFSLIALPLGMFLGWFRKE